MKVSGVLFATLWLAACVNPAASAQRAAVISNPAEAHAELQDVLRQALGGRQVTIADDALTRDSNLIIESARPRDAQGRLLNGRELGMPERFHLVIQASQCMLLHEATGKSWFLHIARCKAI